jgi:hypothetical protein
VEVLFARAPAPCRGEHPKVKQRQAHSAQLKQGLVGPVHFIMYIVEDNKKILHKIGKQLHQSAQKKIGKQLLYLPSAEKVTVLIQFRVKQFSI